MPIKPQPSEFTQTATSAGMIGATAFGSAIIGFFLQLLVAYHFGAAGETDAYFMALSTSEMLSKLLLGGSITAVFLPIFVERITRGKRAEAWDIALNIFHLTAALFAVLTIILGIFARPFVHFIAPGFAEATSELTISLLRTLLPAFVFLFLTEFATSMLHALRRFRLPAVVRLVSPLISILSIILTVRFLGIYSLAIGTLLGAVVQFAALTWGLFHQGLRYRLLFRPFDPAIKRLFYLTYPFFISVLVTQGAGIVYRILVSDLPAGSLATLKYAEKITQLLTIIFLNSVTLVIFPLLSAKAAERDFRGMRETIGSAIRLITFITLPVLTGVALLREPLIAFVYQHGSFGTDDAAMTAIALLFLVIGLTTNGISSVLGHAVLALQQTRAAVAVSIASQAVAIALFVLFTPTLAHAGLALASSLVPLSIGLLYFLYLQRFIPNLKHIFWHATYLKTILLSLLMAVIIHFSLRFAAMLSIPELAAAVVQLVVPTVVGGAIYFFLAHLWHVPEMHELTRIVQAKRNQIFQSPKPPAKTA